MPYDEKLAERVGKALGRVRGGVEPKKMFGGVAFMVRGKMVCGVANDELMLRVGVDRYEAALKKPGARPMDFTGRPLKGYVYVSPRALKTPKALKGWVDLALENLKELER